MSLMDETQQLEVESLAAIYGDDAVQLLPAAAAAATTSTGSVVQVRLPVDLGLETVVRLSPEAEGVAGALSELQLRLTHLPPVLLELLLPPAYPVSSPPQLVDARLPPDAPYCSATSLRQRLLALLARAYDESGRDLCLWAFLELVREGHFLDRSDEGAGGAVLLQPAAGDDVAALGGALSKHEASVLGQTFAETTFPCGICLENRKGAKCVEFRRCRHVFCRECVDNCFSLAIREGDVLSVSCPSFDCIKARTSSAARARPTAIDDDDDEDGIGDIVLDLIGAEARKRWLWLKEKKRHDADATRTICPQPLCQASVPAPPSLQVADEDADGMRVPNGWDRFRECPACGFSFCDVCSRTWHGPHSACPLSSIPAFIKQYYDLAENDPVRRQLEARYGKRNLEQLAAKAREDDENRKWLEANSRNCPGCQVVVEKSVGCNHMICARCQAHFCYSCGSSVSPTEPYVHWNTPGGRCFQRLFDAEDVAAWAGGGAVWEDAAFR